MSRLIQFNEEDGKVVDIIKLRDDATSDNVAVIEGKLPEHTHKEGYIGNLHYNAKDGLHYQYTAVEPIDEDELYVDAETALNIILTSVSEEDEDDSSSVSPLPAQLTKKQAKEIAKLYRKLQKKQEE